MTKQLMYCIVEIAENMLCSGAEVYRVEESIERMCASYGVIRTDAYVTTSNVVITVQNPDGTFHTHARRIRSSTTDIEKLHKLNELVREVCASPLETATLQARIKEALAVATYPAWQQVLAYAAIAGSFTVFFGGRQFAEILISTLIGAAVGLLVKVSEHKGINRIMLRFICSALSSLVAFCTLHLGLVSTVDNIIIGNIMSLIPGIGMTNSLRDLFEGDTMTGINRAIEAVLLSAAMVLGYISIAYVFGGVFR